MGRSPEPSLELLNAPEQQRKSLDAFSPKSKPQSTKLFFLPFASLTHSSKKGLLSFGLIQMIENNGPAVFTLRFTQ